MNEKEGTCCFVGHRQLPAWKIEHIVWRLNEEIERLVGEGVTTFLSGGALGFDQMAAALIAAKKEMGYNIRLILILPYRNQDDLRPEKAKGLYGYLRESADEVRYISKTHISKCVEIRSEYMVEHSTHCICALHQDESDVGHVVRYAKHKNLHVVNIASP